MESKIEICSISYAGRDSMDKRRDLALLMRKNNSRALLITESQYICWLLNIRETTSSMRAVLLQSCNVLLFTDSVCDEEIKEWLWSVDILPFDSFDEYLENNSHFLTSITVDFDTIGDNYLSKIKSSIILENYRDYLLLKSLKNPIEIANLKVVNRLESVVFEKLKQFVIKDCNRDLLNKKLLELRAQNKEYLNGNLELETIQNQAGTAVACILKSKAKYFLGNVEHSRVLLKDNDDVRGVGYLTLCHTAALKLQIALATYTFNDEEDFNNVVADAIIAIKEELKENLELTAEIINDFGYIGVNNLPHKNQVLTVRTMAKSNTFKAELGNLYLVSSEEDDLFFGSNDACRRLEILTVLPFEEKLIDFSKLTMLEKQWLEDYKNLDI